jgi:hypothetical protein
LVFLKKKLCFESSIPALRAPAFSSFGTASHLDSLSVDKGICYLAPGIMQVPPCGFAGDSQSLCRLFLFKPFEVDKPDQFNLLRFERDAFVLFTQAAAGLVTTRFPGSFNNTPDARPSPPGARGHFWFFAVRHLSISCDQSISWQGELMFLLARGLRVIKSRLIIRFCDVVTISFSIFVTR